MSDLTRDHDPNATQPTADASDAPRGELLAGRYRLGEPLGEGGMGTVFRAEQLEPVRRAVAVKLIRAGRDSAAMLLRFEAERQALARMTHPHIARVFDAGTAADGRPFVVMELVDGPPITDYCTRNGLTRKQRLELFRQVCEAVTHAHQKGVIHRDLKPSNILVGADGPKVIDFGLAKATAGKLTDDTLHTGVGSILGTPMYMAPEQAWSDDDVDTRADVFALGAILYELLTGTPPHTREELKGLPLDELIARVRAADIPPPSRRAAVPRELDWIALKALAKDRDRRYATPAELSEDVRRHLADEPVTARRPTAGYRLRKFARRHRVGLIVGAVLLTSAGVSGWSLWQVRSKAAEQKFQADIENEMRLATEAHAFGDEVGMLDDWLDGLPSKKFGLPGPDDRPPHQQTVPVTALLEYYRRSALKLANRPASGLGLLGVITEMRAQHRMASILARFGLHQEAVEHARRAAELADYLAGPARKRVEAANDREFVPTSCGEKAVLAMHLARAGEYEAADRALAEAAETREWCREYGAAVLDHHYDWPAGIASLYLGRWQDADRYLDRAVPHMSDRRFLDGLDETAVGLSSDRAAAVVNQFAALGQPELAAKWRAAFTEKGWLPELAPPPRPAGVR